MRTAAFSTPFGIGVEVTGLTERGQALGLAGDTSLGILGAETTMATLVAQHVIADIALTARVSASTTRVRGGSALLRFDRTLVGTAFTIEGKHYLLGGLATFGLSSPLRLQRARAIVSMPVSFDLATGALVTSSAAVDLTPRARELDLEIGWTATLSPSSSLRLGVARAFDAGHVAGATDTAGFLTLALS